MKKLFVLLMVALTLVGCDTDATVVSRNLSTEADQFRIRRRIVFINVINDSYLFEVTGNCSIEHDELDNQLEVTCKIGKDKYQKHYFGLSDNVSYTVEQLEWLNVSEYDYKIVFKPKSIVPIDISVE